MNSVDDGYFFENFFGRILSPFERFLRRTTAGGIILLAATAIALTLANLGAAGHISSIIKQPIGIRIADWHLQMPLHAWVNDGLMTLFFLLVGLELKRELIVGELSSLKDASLPIAAALGGMIIPAVIYSLINPEGPAARGWGIPMATDIAFAVGILVLLSWRIPSSLIVFLTALAIADDLGAVAIIAIFYTSKIVLPALFGAIFTLTLLFLLNRGRIVHPLPYAVFGLLLWYFMLKSGVHPTIAGVLLAFSIPAGSRYTPLDFAERIQQLQIELQEETADPHACEHAIHCPRMVTVAENLEKAARTVQSPQQHLEHTLSPWVTFMVLPIFAFSNMGIDFSNLQWEAAFSPVTIGIIFGLVPGKLIGIIMFSFLAVRFGIGRLPTGVSWRQLIGVSWLGGIGFTMSLFISNLAFADPANLEEAKIGILAASIISGAIGLIWLYFGTAKAGRNTLTTKE
jgi:Na+:H+ antiporter, NhaA family